MSDCRRFSDLGPRRWNFLYPISVPCLKRTFMKAYLNNLPMRTWLLLVVPAVVLAYPVARIVVPAVVHAVVPEVVRSVLTVI
jgi:hypothetical protein